MARTQPVDGRTGSSIDFGDLHTNLAYIRKYLSESYPPIKELVVTDATLSDVLWLRVGTSGALKMLDGDGNTVTMNNLSAGEKIPGACTKVFDIGTTCTNIIAFKSKSS